MKGENKIKLNKKRGFMLIMCYEMKYVSNLCLFSGQKEITK